MEAISRETALILEQRPNGLVVNAKQSHHCLQEYSFGAWSLAKRLH